MAPMRQQQAFDDYTVLPEDIERAESSSSELNPGSKKGADLLNPKGTGWGKEKSNLLVLEEQDPYASQLPAFSLDDLDDFEDIPAHQSEPQSVNISSEAIHDNTQSPAGEKQNEVRAGKWISWKWISLIGILCVLLAAGIFVFLQWPKMGNEPVEIRKMVRFEIPYPHYQQELEFFVLSSASQEKNIISVGMVIDFIGLSPSGGSRDNDILLRDGIYSFLKSRQPEKNTLAFWQRTVEVDLPLQLKVIMPERKVKAVQIKHLERL